MKMIGISRLASAMRLWRSRPERPGSRTSNTRQLGPSARRPPPAPPARNSWAVAKVATPNPAERTRPPSASRTADAFFFASQDARPVAHVPHRLDPIHHEVQCALLQLHAVTEPRREIGGQSPPHHHTVAAHFAFGEGQHFLDGLVQVQWLLL